MTSSTMSSPIYPFLDSEVRDYYEKVSKGLIEERSYDSWGPETAEEEAHWKRWWYLSPVYVSFHPIYWHTGFTGRGLKKRKRSNMETPGLVGPMGERLEMDTVHTCDQEKPKKTKRFPRSLLSKFRNKY